MSENDENLLWKEETDIKIRDLHLTCNINKREKETSIVKEDKKYFQKNIDSITYKNCKPTVKNNKTIDTKKRIFSQSIIIASESRKEIDPYDKSFDIDIRKKVFDDMISDKENELSNSDDVQKQIQLKNELMKLNTEITNIKNEKETSIQSKLFSGIFKK